MRRQHHAHYLMVLRNSGRRCFLWLRRREIDGDGIMSHLRTVETLPADQAEASPGLECVWWLLKKLVVRLTCRSLSFAEEGKTTVETDAVVFL